MKRKVYNIKRKVYNEAPTPDPICEKFLKAYNDTCKDYNTGVKVIKEKADDYRKKIKLLQEENTKTTKEVKDIEAEALVVLNKFAVDLKNTPIYNISISLGTKFLSGGISLENKKARPDESVNCYFGGFVTGYDPTKAAAAILTLIHLRQVNEGSSKDVIKFNVSEAEKKLQALGFANLIAKDFIKDKFGNLIYETITVNGVKIKRLQVKETSGNGKPGGGGIALMRDATNLFVAKDKNVEILKKLRTTVDKNKSIETNKGLIKGYKDYLENNKNEDRIKDKKDLNDLVKKYRKALDTILKDNESYGCKKPPVKCDEPKL